MADVRECFGGGAALPTDIKFYTAGAITGITMVTEDGDRQFELDGSGAGVLDLTTPRANPAVSGDYVTTLFGLAWKGDLAGGGGDAGIPIYQASNKFGYHVHLQQVGTSDHYVVSIHNEHPITGHSIIGTGTIQIEADSVDPERALVRIDSGGGVITTWISIDGGALTKDIEAAGGTAFGPVLGQDGAGIDATKPVYLYRPQSWAYDDPVARPGIDLRAYQKHPNGDYASADWGSLPDCDDASGTSGNWDEWNGGASDDDGSANCEQGGAAGSEVSEMTDPDPIAYPTRAALILHKRVKANAVAKTCTLIHRIEDGANVQEHTAINIASDGYDHRSVAFNTDPNQTTWSQAKFNLVKGGARSVDTDNANLIVTTFGGEVLSTSDDPVIPEGVPAHAYDYRRRRVATCPG